MNWPTRARYAKSWRVRAFRREASEAIEHIRKTGKDDKDLIRLIVILQELAYQRAKKEKET